MNQIKKQIGIFTLSLIIIVLFCIIIITYGILGDSFFYFFLLGFFILFQFELEFVRIMFFWPGEKK